MLLGIRDDLLRFREQMIVLIIAAGIVAFVRFVLAADLRARLVNAAPVVILQVPTRAAKLNEPVAVLDKHADSAVQQIPAHVVEIALCFRLVDRQRDVVAALARTVFAENISHRQTFPCQGANDGGLYVYANPGVKGMPPHNARTAHVRIIAGRWRSRKLTVPNTPRTRPMPDRIRESIFSILAARYNTHGMLPALHVADLFAGSGSMGFEAVSRGAARCSFIERKGPALSALRENIKTLDAAATCVITKADAWTMPLTTPRPDVPYGIIFVDPPYADARDASRSGRVPRLLADLFRAKWADSDTVLVLHHEARVTWAPDERACWEVLDRRAYGGAAVTIIMHQAGVCEDSGDRQDSNSQTGE